MVATVQPGQFAVGQLYLGTARNGMPTWSQPGGIGTPVFPAQPQGEHSALYTAGCLHWFNVYEIYQVYDPYGLQQVKLLCCPLCSFINQIITPAENYNNYEITPIVTG